MAVAKKSFPVENFSYFVFVPIVTTRKPCRWRVVWLLQLSLRFSTVKFQFTVCVTKAPMFREISHGAPFCSSIPPSRIMPTKILPSNKSSRRRLNTGSSLNSRQEATPASAEVGPSTSSTPSVSLRGDAESAEVSSSLSGQPTMEITHFPFRQVISRKPLFSTRKPLSSTRKPLYFTNNRS